MEKITVKKLTNRHVDKVILRSVVISICIVQVEIDGVRYQVVDEKGQIVRFNGPEHANNVLGRMTTDRAVLLHQSPYAEMAGQPEGEPTPPLEVDFNWRADRA
ncbi:DUF6482 family protein [Alcanivorax marinus]|uniref:DUF6482 family protein n=2 Tax=Alloalcanivorax marinus TaxID=1177169 RepID=A0A9Q3UNN1_9GAMM|nr:DUF6482 family protein [Alloalcanivorax marinus]MBM7334144.1 hypothetical protein [Alloalcanivorax marinus]MCC4308629.1 DUF6482 family protein [Alloalcanivorax marinus]